VACETIPHRFRFGSSALSLATDTTGCAGCNALLFTVSTLQYNFFLLQYAAVISAPFLCSCISCKDLI
jgi:hypothetical protein